MLGPMDIMCCHTCHALLPLSQCHVPHGTQDHLLGRVVDIWIASDSFQATLAGCTYGAQQTDERHFSLVLPSRERRENLYASQV